MPQGLELISMAEGLAGLRLGQELGVRELGLVTKTIVHRCRFFGLGQKPTFDFGVGKSGSKEIDPARPIVFTSGQLRAFTNNFDEENLIGPTQFGQVYRGKIQQGMIGREAQDVIVKIWDEHSYRLILTDDYVMVKEEVLFLTHPSAHLHPNLVNLIGFCCEREVTGVVYDLNPLDTLHNLMMKDDFNWLQRIKVAIEFARLLEFLHGQDKPYLVLNIDAWHIMLDQDYNPILFDFGLMSGGIIGELSVQKKLIPMSPGYVDLCFATIGGWWETCCDVFSYGVILLGLIAKRVVNKDKFGLISSTDLLVDEWAKKEYKPNCSLVHNSLERHSGYYAPDGLVITELAMRCIKFAPETRPAMKEVVECLGTLQVHGDAIAASN
uniref:Protein kinase domain-containing protein n=1 Tax=Davidia involucrata TaxID=16924 RepID=A0A5B6Z1J7_DAVIN